MNRRAKALNRSNNELDKRINEENQDVFTDIICYIRGADISEYDQEVVRRDLTEMVLAAQKRGEGIDIVIGEDYKTFCDSVIETFPVRTGKQKAMHLVDMASMCMAIFGVMLLIIGEVTYMASHGLRFSMTVPVSLGTVIIFAASTVIAFVVVGYITKKPFDMDGSRKEAVAAGLIGAAIFIGLIVIGILGRNTVFNMKLIPLVGFIAAVYAAHKIAEYVD